MNSFNIKKVFKSWGDIAIAVFVVCAVTSLSLLGFFTKLEFRAYDALLGLASEPEQSKNIVLVEIDDSSISSIGDWPWPRNVLGDALLRMKELGAHKAVFDIEYLSPSSKVINSKSNDEKDAVFEKEKESINDVIKELTNAFYSGSVKKKELKHLSQQMLDDYINPSIDKMKQSSEALIIDNDKYLADCIRAFENTWLTVNVRDVGIKRSEDEINFVKDNFLSSKDYVIDNDNLVFKGNEKCFNEELLSGYHHLKKGFTPALDVIVRNARGVGFTNSIVDFDGSRRRIELLTAYDDKYLKQLALSPLCAELDVKSIERKDHSVILHDALIPGNDDRCDIKIPLDSNGCMLINWLHSKYIDSFKGQHESVQFLYILDKIEENIANCIQSISAVYIPDSEGEAMAYYKNAVSLNDLYLYVKDCKEKVLDGELSFDDYALCHQEFFRGISSFIDSQYLENVLLTLSSYDNGENTNDINQVAFMLKNYWDVIEKDYATYANYTNEMKKVYDGSICFIGFTAAASTDFGVNPFDKTYANLGVHANVANTILQQSFITPVKEYKGLSSGYLFAVLFTFLIILIVHKKGPGIKNASGVLYAVLPFLCAVLFFVCANIYVPVVDIIFACLMIFAGEVIFNFITVSGDKKFLQNTFGAYVAPEIVKEIVKNPDVARLGGKSEYITALFSDVASFSAFTEVINNEELLKVRQQNAALPANEQKSSAEVDLLGASRGAERLVHVLNDYLGVLSDAIMDNCGTIDKYVGDEIVSFFGAPVPDKSNAFHACVAAIRMRQAEQKYNDENAYRLPVNPQTGKPFYLHSRIGLNTGNMVVGNMGTDKKLNYTIMGNHVNLASRLEGANKVYNSWIMVSEDTWKSADSGEHKGKLLARRLDNVRVINVKKPVGIYSIVGLKSELSSERIKSTEVFNQAMDIYLRGADTPETAKSLDEIKLAYDLFVESDHICDEDGTSRIFIERCEDLIKNGLPEKWDGIYTMKTK